MNSDNGSPRRYISFGDIGRAPSSRSDYYDEPFETIISDIDDVDDFESQTFAVIETTNQELEWEFPKQVRLHLVDSERHHFLKCLNTPLLRKLVTIQVIATTLIVISEVGVHAFLSSLILFGLGVAILIYTPACWLSHINSSDPSGCSIGFAMGFQILSICNGILRGLFTIFEIYIYLHHRLSRVEQLDFEGWTSLPGVIGLICFFVVVLGSLTMAITSTLVTALYCRATCCVKSKMRGDKVFALDVETVNIQPS